MFSPFWDRHPALFLGFSLLLGTAAAFRSPLLFVAIFILLILSIKRKGLIIAATFLFFASLISAPLRHPKTTLSSGKVTGIGLFHIDDVKTQTSPFYRSLLYKGTLRHFQGDGGEVYTHLPCHVYLPLRGKNPPAHCDYEIEGTLSQKGDHFFILKPTKKKTWSPIKDTHSFAKWRYQTKQKLSRYLKKEIKNPTARTLLSALATGDIDERLITM